MVLIIIVLLVFGTTIVLLVFSILVVFLMLLDSSLYRYKQKKGKKRMRQIGNVEVPQSAFLAVLKMD